MSDDRPPLSRDGGRWSNADVDAIVVVPSDPRWPAVYADEAARIRAALPTGLAMELEHVGSTAVPGLAAKPIVDIDLRLPGWSGEWPPDAVRAALGGLGYLMWEDPPNHVGFVKGMPPFGTGRTHHVHLFRDAAPYAERLRLRDHLRRDVEEARRYESLKRELAVRFRADRDAYTEQKTAFVTAALARAEVLDFWFGTEPDDAAAAVRQEALWWSQRGEDDRAIAERFAPLVEAAARRELDDWARTSRGLLALVLLTDQFPRCLFRGGARAFAFDALALGSCERALAEARDLRLRPIERAFLYLPLEHAESLEHQERAVALYRALAGEVPAAWRPLFTGYLGYAEGHRDVIARFGRFPHRNSALGRGSTADELAYLAEPGSGF
jgi:uncharacterized protein (DUF924 family)/GrpB-like predicted nucleotidyltransferase (UPF0157 family)